jgi:hypothetical protein
VKKQSGGYSKSWQSLIAMMMMTVPVLAPSSELHFMAVCKTLFHLAISWSELFKLLNMTNSWIVPFLCVKE